MNQISEKGTQFTVNITNYSIEMTPSITIMCNEQWAMYVKCVWFACARFPSFIVSDNDKHLPLFVAIDTLNCFQFQSMTNMPFSNENHKISYKTLTFHMIAHLVVNGNIYRIRGTELTRTRRKITFFAILRTSNKQSIVIRFDSLIICVDHLSSIMGACIYE